MNFVLTNFISVSLLSVTALNGYFVLMNLTETCQPSSFSLTHTDELYNDVGKYHSMKWYKASLGFLRWEPTPRPTVCLWTSH